MKLLLLFAAVLSCHMTYHVTSGQVICCAPFMDYQIYTNLYLGMVDLNLLPGTPPEAYLGTARVSAKYSEQLMLTEYIDWADIPGFQGRAAILGDYRQNPGRIYDVYTNGTCLYTDYQDIFMTPPCVPDTWQHIESFYLGTDILVDRYGDDVLKNYLNVLNSNCQPLVNLATRRNQPSQGIYRFNTEFYTNGTEFTGTIEIPSDCQPHKVQKTELPDFLPLSSISLTRDPGTYKALRATVDLKPRKTPKLRSKQRKNKTPK